ncbi:MAG TPA: phage tail tube protein [Gemmatimonadales bacterium]|jgi:hypothetical protein
MIYRERVQAVLFKKESVSGVDATPDGTFAVRTKGIPVIEVDNLEMNTRDDEQTGVLSGADDSFAAGWYGKLDVVIELTPNTGTPSPTRLPFYDDLWQCCGLARQSDYTVGAEFHRYVTIDQSMLTGTCYAYCAGKLVKLVSCCVNPKISATVNQVATVTFSITGKCIAISETTIPALSFPDVLAGAFPFPWNGTLGKFGAWDSTNPDPVMMLAANVDLGNVISDIPSANAQDGLVGYTITDRSVTADYTIYVPQLATFNPFDLARSPYSAQPTSFQLGQNAGQKITVTLRFKPRKPTFGARNGLRTYQLNGVAKVGGGLTSGREYEVQFS